MQEEANEEARRNIEATCCLQKGKMVRGSDWNEKGQCNM